MKAKVSPKTIRDGINRIVEWPSTAYVAMILILFFLLFPFFWTFLTSFKSMQEVFKWPPTFIPHHFTFSAYKFSLLKTPTPLYILNSLIYSLSTAVFITIIGTITTYGLSMYPYKGSDEIFLAFYATRIIPPQILWLPFIIIFSKIGLVNTRPGVIIYEIALAYPLCIWMLKGIFDAFPHELIDSASIDGCSKLGILFRIVMPITVPGIAAVAMIAFLWTWNDFMFPLLLLNTDHFKPLTVGVYYFVGDEGIIWNSMAATEVMAIVPGIIIFIIAQKYIVSGLTAGALK